MQRAERDSVREEERSKEKKRDNMEKREGEKQKKNRYD